MTRPSRLLFSVLLFICCGLPSIAGSFYTINDGVWSSPGVWLNGLIPPLSGNDTIFIHHHIIYTSPTVLTTTTELTIDTAGSLCGHERFYIQNTSNINNYGNFYADTLVINGGHLYNNGFVDLTNTAVVTNGGSIVNNGSMAIGLLFNCGQVANDIPGKEKTVDFSVFPNPASCGQEIQLHDLPPDCELFIIDLQGKIICHRKTEEAISVNGLSPGVYFIEVRTENSSFHRKIIITE